jgi:hypothetical protein
MCGHAEAKVDRPRSLVDRWGPAADIPQRGIWPVDCPRESRVRRTLRTVREGGQESGRWHRACPPTSLVQGSGPKLPLTNSENVASCVGVLVGW